MARIGLTVVVAGLVVGAGAWVALGQAGVAAPPPSMAPSATQVAAAKLESKTLQKPSPGVQKGDTLFVKYTGKLQNGTVFDSSENQGGRLFRFKVGEGAVIKGWEEGVIGMEVGEKRELVIPPALAYGAEGRPPTIPANSTLTFEIELVGMVRMPAEANK